MTATLDPVRPAHGGPAPRWSPRRLGHHRYLWWAGALLLAGVAAAIAVTLDPSPEPGIADDGAVNVLTAVIVLVPILVWGLVHQLVSAIRRRARDDVRTYGTGQPVRVRRPGPQDAGRPGDTVRYVVDVDHVPGAVTVNDRQDRGGPSAFLDDGDRRLRLRARAGQMTASGAGGPVFVARRFGPAGAASLGDRGRGPAPGPRGPRHPPRAAAHARRRRGGGLAGAPRPVPSRSRPPAGPRARASLARRGGLRRVGVRRARREDPRGAGRAADPGQRGRRRGLDVVGHRELR